jgi:ABC-2 type transport system ATP-binding protein
LPMVDHVKHLYSNTWQLSSATGTDVRKEIFDFAVRAGISVLTLSKEEQKMEDVFKELTRRRN